MFLPNQGLKRLRQQAPAWLRAAPALALNRLAGRLRPRQTADLLRRAQRQYPADFWLNHNLGITLVNLTPPEPDEAVRFLTAAVAVRPDSPGAHYDLGMALRAKGRLDEAIACYRKALELDPQYAAAYVGQGIALHDRGQVDEAIASYHKALALDPKDIYAHTNMGVALGAKGQADEAIACHRKAIEIDSKYAKAHYNLGNAVLVQGRLDEAIACYRKALELDPKDTAARSNLARAERLATARDKLPAFQKGDYTPATNDERLGLVEWCQVWPWSMLTCTTVSATASVSPLENIENISIAGISLTGVHCAAAGPAKPRHPATSRKGT